MRANLDFVKAFRVLLLLLLAVLLPVRGAVAAAMLCPVAGSGMQNEWRAPSPAHQAMDHAMAHGTAGAHDGQAAAGHGHDHGHHQGHDQGQASDECNMCSAYCSITPLVQDVPRLPAPLDPPAVKFPDLSSPAPIFLSDGQERPPRST